MSKSKWIFVFVPSIVLAIVAACSTGDPSSTELSPDIDVSSGLTPSAPPRLPTAIPTGTAPPKGPVVDASVDSSVPSAACSVTIQYWGRSVCPGCERIKAQVDGWKAKYSCVSISTEESSTTIAGGYPRIKGVEPSCGESCIAGHIAALAEKCGCNKKVGRCFCNKWTGSSARGYQCAAQPTSIEGELPSCDKVDECQMSYEACDSLPPPKACEKVVCKDGRSPRCQIEKDTTSRNCDGKCDTKCGTDGSGNNTCTPDCSDKDCCKLAACVTDPLCGGIPKKPIMSDAGLIP
jgi:hypothetical protein